MLKDRLYKDTSGNVYTTKYSNKDYNGATSDSEGVSYRDDGARLIGTRDKGLTTYDVCPGTITINEIAFFNCKKLESVEIACTVVAIGASAFRLTALEEVVIPDSVEAIEKYAFCDIKSLKRVVFDGEVAEIDPKAFFGSDAIEEVVVPADSVEHYKALLPNLADKISASDSGTVSTQSASEANNGNEAKAGKNGAMKEIVVTFATQAGAAYDLCPVGEDEEDVVNCLVEDKDYEELKQFMEDSDKTRRSYAYNEYEPVTVTAKEGDKVVFEEEYCEATELYDFDLCSDNIVKSEEQEKVINAIRQKVADDNVEKLFNHYLCLFLKAGLNASNASLVIGHRRDTPLVMTYTIQIPADEEFDVSKLCIMSLSNFTYDWHPRYDAEDSGERCASVILYDGTLYEGACSEEDEDGKETLWATNDVSSYKSLIQNRDGGNDDDDNDFFEDDFNPFKDDEDSSDDDETDENTDEEEESDEDGTKCLTIEGIGFDVIADNGDNSDDFIVITEGLKITLDGEDITDLVSKEPYNDNEQILDEINDIEYAFWEFCSIDEDKNLVRPTHCECTLDVDGDFDPSKIRLLRSGDVDGEWPEIVLQHAKFGPNFNHNRDAIPNLTGFLASHIYYDDELMELDIQEY